ncbi:hypothetical protein CLU79DRAFT_771744 [Phycomyces nitens]|nr:hypothetical protein CLU79DRAFT_771744 [Phycomyces nitens]
MTLATKLRPLEHFAIISQCRSHFIRQFPRTDLTPVAYFKIAVNITYLKKIFRYLCSRTFSGPHGPLSLHIKINSWGCKASVTFSLRLKAKFNFRFLINHGQ